MSQMFISPQEPQFGIRNGWCDNNALTGISCGSNDIIMELLLRRYEADVALTKGTGASAPYYLLYADNTAVNYFLVYQTVFPPTVIRILFTGAELCRLPISTMFRDVVHLMIILRATSYIVLLNGHQVKAGAKAAHNINTTEVRIFSALASGTPSIGCLARIYFCDLSGFSDAQLLAVHRKYLSTPFVRIPELNTYLKFAWEGRQADTAPGVIGPQILDSATTIANAINGETLLIQGGLKFGQVKAQVWTPR